jgi:hypothetical protein
MMGDRARARAERGTGVRGERSNALCGDSRGTAGHAMPGAPRESSMSDGLSRLRLPLLLLSLVLLIGGSRFDTLRPVEGQVLAFAVPVIAVVSGVSPFRDAHGGLQAVVFALGALVLGVALFGSYGVVFTDTVEPLSLARALVLGAAMIGAVLLEVAGAQRHLRSRLSAWLGLAIVFALFFPGHASPKNLFGSVFGAFMVALFAGGGGGLFLGEFAVRTARR